MGNIIDTDSMEISLPPRRTEPIVKGCRSLMAKSKDSIREVARVVGLLVAATPAVELGKLHYRKLESAKISALRSSKDNLDAAMDITSEMKVDLSWWLDNVSVQRRKIFRSAASVELYTDASNSGWGGTYPTRLLVVLGH